MITSKKSLFISSAVSLSIAALVTSTPPKAETGSPASASVHASSNVGLEAKPQALLCFNIANVISSNSSIKSNFALIYKAYLNKSPSVLFNDEEFKTYCGIIISFATVIALVLFFDNKYNFVNAITSSFFQTVSVVVTAGFASVDFEQWKLAAKLILFCLFFCGGCAGSSGGGIKVVRWLFVFKFLKKEVAKILHPNGVYPVKINKTIVPNEVMQQILAFVLFYFFVFGVSALIISIAEGSTLIGDRKSTRLNSSHQ